MISSPFTVAGAAEACPHSLLSLRHLKILYQVLTVALYHNEQVCTTASGDKSYPQSCMSNYSEYSNLHKKCELFSTYTQLL